MKITFHYEKQVDLKCWQRYNDFINIIKTVWGIQREIKQLFSIDNISMDADVSYMSDKFEEVFSIPNLHVEGYVTTVPFSMINDDEAEVSEKGIIYYSIFTPNPSVVLAHELFHIYFEKYTNRNIPNYDESKEYFTVILNDLFEGNISKGYPIHQEMRKKIFEIWLKTKSIDKCIESLNRM